MTIKLESFVFEIIDKTNIVLERQKRPNIHSKRRIRFTFVSRQSGATKMGSKKTGTWDIVQKRIKPKNPSKN